MGIAVSASRESASLARTIFAAFGAADQAVCAGSVTGRPSHASRAPRERTAAMTVAARAPALTGHVAHRRSYAGISVAATAPSAEMGNVRSRNRSRVARRILPWWTAAASVSRDSVVGSAALSRRSALAVRVASTAVWTRRSAAATACVAGSAARMHRSHVAPAEKTSRRRRERRSCSGPGKP